MNDCAAPDRLSLILEKLVRSVRSVAGRLILTLDFSVSFVGGKGTNLLSPETEDIEYVSVVMAIFNSSYLSEGEWLGRPLRTLYSNP